MIQGGKTTMMKSPQVQHFYALPRHRTAAAWVAGAHSRKMISACDRGCTVRRH
jgi:hypothetical protein